MKIGHGVVKKYSREYHRTLKTGEKKKYTTSEGKQFSDFGNIGIVVTMNDSNMSNKQLVRLFSMKTSILIKKMF